MSGSWHPGRVANEFRGRVFATMESMVWSTMMISMMLAGIASQYYDPRLIAAVAGVLSSMTAVFWGLGALDRPIAATRGGRRASGGRGSAWGTHHLVCRAK